MEEKLVPKLNFDIVDKKQLDNIVQELSKKIIAAQFTLIELKDWFWPIYKEYEEKNPKQKKMIDAEIKDNHEKFSDLVKYIAFVEKQILVYKSM